MKAKKPAPDSAAVADPWTTFAGAGQQAAATAADCAAEMFSGFEAMRKVQEQAAHAAAERHAAAADRLKGGCAPADLLAVQSDLVTFDLQGATRYWQQLGCAALEMQTRVLGCCGHWLDSDVMLETAAAIDKVTGREGRAGR